jgi:uncharacterized protein (TIGR03067 family)
MQILDIVGLAFLLAAPGSDERPKKLDLSALVGEWACTSLVYAGNKAPDPNLTFEFTSEGKLRMGRRGIAGSEAGTYKATSGKNPATFDWDTGDVGTRYWGIYKVEGETLTLCYCEGEVGERPTQFKSPAGTKLMLMTLQRVKKKE